MEFAHPQPFTYAEVSQLDISTLSEEITRLQNSLHHLKSTQDELQSLIDTTSTPDAEFLSAVQENKQVIDSQEERVLILKHVLAQKGAPYSSHYDLSPPEPHPSSAGLTEHVIEHVENDNEEGIHL